MFGGMAAKKFVFKEALTPLIGLVVNVHPPSANRSFPGLTSQSVA